jgi:hypothetical protein
VANSSLQINGDHLGAIKTKSILSFSIGPSKGSTKKAHRTFVMHHPFQRIAAVDRNPAFLLAASGSSLVSVNLNDGTIAAKWELEGTASLKPSTEVRDHGLFYAS